MNLGLGLSITSPRGMGAFVPSQLSGRILWLRPDLGMATSSGEVTGWADQSGIGDPNRNFIPQAAGDRPALNASVAAYNNQPTIGTFNKVAATDSCRLKSGVWNASYTTPTIIIVGNCTGAGVNRFYCTEQISDYIAISQSSVGPGVRVFSGDGTSFINSTVSSATPRVMIASFNGASSELYVDSFTTPTTSGPLTAPSLGTHSFILGSLAGGSSSYGVDAIAEVYIDSRPFASWPVADVRALGAYLNTRYGKSITLP